MAVLSAVLTAVSGAVSAVGAIQQGNAAQAAANYNAKVHERNAIIADQDRRASVKQAQVDAEDKRRDNRRTLSTLRAAYGGSGLEMAGSPLDVLEDSALELELDASRIEYEGRVKNREGGIRSTQSRESATLSRMEGSAAKSASYISAFGYLASGISGAANRLTQPGLTLAGA